MSTAAELQLVTDLVAGLPEEVAAKYGIAVVRRQVRVGEKVVPLNRLEALPPRRAGSQPPALLEAEAEAYLRVFEHAHRSGRRALALVPPESVDSAYRAATYARNLLPDPGNFAVLRLGLLGMGLRSVVEAVAGFAGAAGVSLPQASAFVKRVAEETRFLLYVEDRGMTRLAGDETSKGGGLLGLFGRSRWFEFGPSGALRTVGSASADPKGKWDRPGNLHVEVTPNLQRKVAKLVAPLAPAKPHVGFLWAIPDRLAQARGLLFLSSVPGGDELMKIRQWVIRWGGSGT
jgi:hypothetical protein